jgi:predicted double-glycine peptidase
LTVDWIDCQSLSVRQSLFASMQTLRYCWLLLPSLLLGGCASVTAFKGIALDEETVYLSGLPPNEPSSEQAPRYLGKGLRPDNSGRHPSSQQAARNCAVLIRQDEHYACGAACVAAVAAYWNVSPAEFRAKHPQMPADATGRDLQVLAEGLGLQAFAYRGSMDDLAENLRKGRPLIVMIPQPLLPNGELTASLLLNAWNQWGPKPAHWVVVVGITKNKAVIIHDPYSGPLVVKPEAFQAWWAKKGNLTVLITAR